MKKLSFLAFAALAGGAINASNGLFFHAVPYDPQATRAIEYLSNPDVDRAAESPAPFVKAVYYRLHPEHNGLSDKRPVGRMVALERLRGGL
jgi:hypothetical protein